MDPRGPAEVATLLRDGSKKLIRLVIPLTICFLLSLGLVELELAVAKRKGLPPVISPPAETPAGDSVIRQLAVALGLEHLGDLEVGFILGGIMILIMALTSTLVVVLYRFFHCLWFLTVYIIVAVTMLIGFLGTRALGKLFFLCGFYVDYATFFFIIWNITVTGTIVMFTYGPVLAHRAYSILYCALFVNFIVQLLRPPLLLWILTVFLCVWDLIAVLCPFGPLKLLVETAQSRGQMNSKFLSALVYTSGFLLSAGSNAGSSVGRKESSGSSNESLEEIPLEEMRSSPGSRRPSDDRLTGNSEEGGESGAKLGLGDFIFYSVVICLSRMQSGPYAVIQSYVIILNGLFLTLAILLVYGKPLPALPIPVFVATGAFFVYHYLVSAFHYLLYTRQIFV